MSPMSVEAFTAARQTAFAAARHVVEQWRASGRRTTTAGVTSALKRDGALDLAALGMRSNREFWEHVAQSGGLALAQQPNGHWLLLLPGEDLDDFLSASSSPSAPRTPHADQELRLKSDVWTSFVDWNPAYRRFWDRTHSRAFMTPVDPGWVPLDLDSARFVEIDPARQDVQIGWMRRFADALTEPDRAAVLASVGDDAPRGAFRRELRDRGLSRAWRIALRDHIVDFALDWAKHFAIDSQALMETRPRAAMGELSASGGHRGAVGSPSVERSRSQRATSSAGSASTYAAERSGSGSGLDAAGLLRQRLHRVLDSMTWDEMSRLPVRAEHLLRF